MNRRSRGAFTPALAVSIALFAVTAVLVSVDVSHADSAPSAPFTAQAALGAYSVSVSGAQISVATPNAAPSISWSLLSSAPSSTPIAIPLVFSSVNRIDDAAQDSLAQLFQGPGVHAAAVETEDGPQLDLSFVIQNLGESAISPLAALKVISPAGTMGAVPAGGGRIFVATAGNPVYFQSPVSTLFGNGFQVSWQSSGTSFALGEAAVVGSGSVSTLLFGPLSIAGGQTLSLTLEFSATDLTAWGALMSPTDPTVQSSLFAPAEPAPCPGCGGGGGGSVTPGTPPSISGDSTNVTYLIPGVPIRLSATVSSYGTLGTGGSGSDVLFYDITNSLGQVSASATMSISTTGTYSFVWTPARSQIGWGGVYVYQPGVYNSCEEGCGTGWGSTIDIQIYEDAPSNLNTSVYDSNGDLIARYTQSSLAFGGTAPVPYIQVGTQVQFSFATATNWTDSVSDGTKVLGIWQVTEAINPNFALFGYSGGSASMGLGYIQDGLQVESNDDFEVYVGDYLIGIANAFLFDLIPELPPWWFEDTNGNGVDYYSQSTYSVTDTGTTQFYLCGKTCGETVYYPIKDSSGTPTRMFDLHTYNDYYSNQVTSYLDVNAYTVTLEYQYGDPVGGANTYTSSATLYTGSWILYYP